MIKLRQAEVTFVRRGDPVLEDRRVLCNPFELEDPRHCIESVVGIGRSSR